MCDQEDAVPGAAAPALPEEDVAWDEDGYADDVDIWPDTEEDCGCEDDQLVWGFSCIDWED